MNITTLPRSTLMPVLALLLFHGAALGFEQGESTCFGTPENGRLENGWKLPTDGKNFRPYSQLGSVLERTFVHSAVHRVVIDAFAILAVSRPTTIYVYGETGNKSGGRFRPHKTHRNGLSVDFMVPVLNKNSDSVPIPSGLFNKFGYGIEFSKNGEFNDLRIDFDALADHLIAISDTAKKNGVGIKRVIFDNDLQELLFKTRRGPELKKLIIFTRWKPWIRHDEHYHVDFVVKCGDTR